MELLLKRQFIVSICIIYLVNDYEICTVNAQRTFLDKFINEYRTFRGGLFKFVGRSDTDSAYIWSLKRQVTNNHLISIRFCSCDTKAKKIYEIIVSIDTFFSIKK